MQPTNRPQPGDRVRHRHAGDVGTVHHLNEYGHPVVVWDEDIDGGPVAIDYWSVEVVTS
ncbi:hypothetical protein [Micromonospora haikouensis]|uniref:hypothetical protein n=1 Tax=Micromonospora haikouensis TaxID=686309 RepID=UPI003D74D55A